MNAIYKILAVVLIVSSSWLTHAGSENEACPSDKPTKIWGNAKGHDGRAVKVMLGFDWLDENGCKVNENGQICMNQDHKPQCAVPESEQSECCARGGYSKCPKVNDTLDHKGVWDNSINTYHQECVSESIVKYSAEIYPKDSTDTTNLSRYGSARDARDIVVGTENEVDFRVPVNFENGGSAGKINGYAYCDGQPAKITRINWWSNDSGTRCGVQGFRSGNRDGYKGDSFDSSTDNGFFSSNFKEGGKEYMVLSAGQCHGDYQKYKWVIKAECPAGKVKSKTYYTDVCSGCGPQVDVQFFSDDQ